MPSLREDLFDKYCQIDSPEERMRPSMHFHKFKVDKRSRGPVFGEYVHLKGRTSLHMRDMHHLPLPIWEEIIHFPQKVTRKLRCVKTRLKALNFHEFANVREKVVEAREALHRAQAAMLVNPKNPDLVGNEKVCLKNFHDLALAEEGFVKQKSRIQWLKLGD